jgi:ArsR family transcriptional regulator
METPLEQEINLLHTQICQALADPKRILLLYILAEGPRRVNDLVEILDAPQPTISHHLKVLRERGLVDVTREGTSAYYELADERIIDAMDTMRAILADMLAQRASVIENILSSDT